MMNSAIWIVQVVLTVVFLMAGTFKATQSSTAIKEKMPLMLEDFKLSIVRGIGIIEILGAIGLILPAVTGILPWLTPLAATGFILVMVGAMATHIRHNDFMPALAINATLLLLALFVAYGRFIAEPFA
jgi:hypothetical protein